MITAFLLAVLIWEILRNNVPEGWLGGWPWRLAVLGVAPAATLAGVSAGVLFARSQFAVTVRPLLAWKANVGPIGSLGEQSAWTVHMSNAGPGLGIIVRLAYSVSGVDANGHMVTRLECGRQQAVETLGRLGLAEGQDFSLHWIGVGAPVAVAAEGTGVEVVSLSGAALTRLSCFDVRVWIRDTVGDTHQRVHHVMSYVPQHLRSPNRLA